MLLNLNQWRSVIPNYHVYLTNSIHTVVRLTRSRRGKWFKIERLCAAIVLHLMGVPVVYWFSSQCILHQQNRYSMHVIWKLSNRNLNKIGQMPESSLDTVDSNNALVVESDCRDIRQKLKAISFNLNGFVLIFLSASLQWVFGKHFLHPTGIVGLC